MPLEAKTVPAPEIGPVWLNSPPLSIRNLRGRNILLDFWDYTCVNCIRGLPYVQEWDRRYRPLGLVTVGVHAPEFFFASVTELVQIAVQDLGLAYPVVLDNEYEIWKSYSNRVWPSKYLIDTEGYLRYIQPGEGNYDLMERCIQDLLRETNPSISLPDLVAPLRALDQPGALQACRPPTPELYLGYGRGELGNESGYQKDKAHDYLYNRNLAPDEVEISGHWIARQDCLELSEGTGALRFQYGAAEVNLVVMSGAKCPIGRAEITLDGRPIPPVSRGQDVRQDESGRTYVEVTRPRMYSIVRRPSFHTAVLELKTASLSMQLFTFTFISSI